MSLLRFEPACPLCGVHCTHHTDALAIGEGVGKEEPLGPDQPHHVVRENVYIDGSLVRTAGERITLEEAEKLGLLEGRAKKLPEDRMAGRHMEDR